MHPLLHAGNVCLLAVIITGMNLMMATKPETVVL
jgi:hypothetical protein